MKRWLLNLLRPRPVPSPVSQDMRDALEIAEARLLGIAAKQSAIEREVAHLQQLKAELLDHASPAPEEAPEWTAEDRGGLLAFLRSPSGRTLMLVLRVQEELLKKAACDDTEKRVDHARGQAVGYRKALGSLIVLSAPPPPKEETADTPDRGADELRDQLSHS